MADKQPYGEKVEEDRTRSKQTREKAHLRGKAERVHEFREAEGYVVDIGTEDAIDSSGLKLARDEHTVLIPQPSDDTNDPLNWTWIKKHLILFVVSIVSFLPDYGSATGAVTLEPQAE